MTFTASGNPGPATQIALNAGNNQSASAGTAVATLPSVIVTDTNNNPVAGVSVTFGGLRRWLSYRSFGDHQRLRHRHRG